MAVAEQRFAHVLGTEAACAQGEGERKGRGQKRVSGLPSVRPCRDRFIPAEGEGNTANGAMRSDKTSGLAPAPMVMADKTARWLI